MMSNNNDMYSPGAARGGGEGRVNSQADFGMIPGLYKQDSVSSSHRLASHMNDSYSYSHYNQRGMMHGLPSDRSS